MGCIATDLRGGGPLDVSVCATPTLGGPLRGVQPLTCGGAVPCTQAAVAVDLRGGGPLYAGGGRTPRKGGLVLASATSFPPFSQSCRAVDSQSLISLSLLSRYIRYYIRYPHGILVLGSASRDLAFATQARGGKIYV